MPVYLLLPFHYKNLERVNIRPMHVFTIVNRMKDFPILSCQFQVASVPIVPTISLAHMADIQQVLNYQVHLMRMKSFCKQNPISGMYSTK